MAVRFALSLLVLVLASPALSQSAIDPDASVIHLRKDCSLPGGAFLDNCFTTTTALTTWLWSSGRTVEPSAGDRVHVEVGPGDFEPFECTGNALTPSDRGWTSIHGSGREDSRFVRADQVNGYSGSCRGAITVEFCDGLSFDNLGAHGPTGALWVGGGTGNWNQVDIFAELTPQNICPGTFGSALAWYDIPLGGSDRSVQFFFSSRIWTLGGGVWDIAFDSLNAESWLYGSDVAAFRGDGDFGGGWGILLNEPSDMRIFGGTVRAVAKPGSQSTEVVGASIPSGTLHMHGGIISVNGSAGTGNVNAVGIRTQSTASTSVTVHTPGTAFAVIPGGAGTATRLVKAGVGNATIDSPFLWQASDSPPSADSLHGQDLFVDTNAGGAGESHLMVRDDTCTGTGGPWRDMATGNCRL